MMAKEKKIRRRSVSNEQQKKHTKGAKGLRTYTKHNVILAVASEVKRIQVLEELR
jgi:hypothetical protein